MRNTRSIARAERGRVESAGTNKATLSEHRQLTNWRGKTRGGSDEGENMREGTRGRGRGGETKRRRRRREGARE